MAISKERKNEIINEYARHEGDTGSPEVQIAVLTEEISLFLLVYQLSKIP